jgi:hypothetical protein
MDGLDEGSKASEVKKTGCVRVCVRQEEWGSRTKDRRRHERVGDVVLLGRKEGEFRRSKELELLK